jgi:hypothetical protein
VLAGRKVITVGELVDVFADQIPLHTATRKWLAGKRPGSGFATPDRMRFYTLTQYLHWVKCTFSGEPRERKSRTTVVYVRMKECPNCHKPFVAERELCCSAACGTAWRHRA